MHDLKRRLHAGESVVGPLVTIGSTEVAEMLSMVGFDYLWIETEHAPTDFVLAQQMIQAAGGRCPCLVRIPEAKEVWVKKALDTGCDGIVVPQVRTAEEARQVVAWSLYPPQGRRSVGIKRFILVPTVGHCQFCSRNLKSTEMVDVQLVGDRRTRLKGRMTAVGGILSIDLSEAVKPLGGFPYRLEADVIR